MIPRLLFSTANRSGATAVSSIAYKSVRSASFLQGRPPVVDTSAGTFAAFYYKNIRQFDTPTKDHMVSYGQDEKFTVGGFDRQVYAYAQGFLEGLGLKKNDKIGVWMTSEVEHLVIQYAAGLLGITIIEMDPSLNYDAVLKIINEEQIRALFLSPRFGKEDRFGPLETIFAKETEIAAVEGGTPAFASKQYRSLKYVVAVSTEFQDGIVRFRDIPVYGNDGNYGLDDDIAVVQNYLNKNDTLTIPYTASKDGKQAIKGKGYSHAELLTISNNTTKALGLKSNDVVLSTAPLHVPLYYAVSALAPASLTAKTIIPSKSFDAVKTLEAVTQQRATVLITCAEHVSELNKEIQNDNSKPAAKRNYNLSSLRGGAVFVPTGSALTPVNVGTVSLKPVDSSKGF